MLSLTAPGVLRTVAGSSLYLTVVVIMPALPHTITGWAPYLPSNTGGALWAARMR